MIKFLIIFSLFISFSFAEEDYPNSQNGPFARDSGTEESYAKGTQALADFIVRLQGYGRSSGGTSNYYNSYYYGNNYNYANRAPQPIYGTAGYTTGQINNYGNIRAQQNLYYNEYLYESWRCVNYYRGQYYYSYNYNGYVCDTRVNRNG